MPPAQTHSTGQYMLWLGLLTVLIVGYLAFRIVFPSPSPVMSTEATMQQLVIPNAPQPTANDYISAQKGFEYLVSYSDTGFSPPSLAVKRNEIIRFVNNSSTVLSLSIGTEPARMLSRGAYVEYTAAEVGNIPYSDNTVVGALHVTE